MIWKKSIFSYIVSVIFLLTAIVALGYYGYVVYDAGQSGGSLTNVLVGAGCWGAILLGIFVLAGIGRKKISNPRVSGHHKDIRDIAEVFFFIGFIVAGLILRGWAIEYSGESAAYYETAKVAEGAGIPQIIHGATYFYVYLLRVLFTLVGNKWIAGIWLQIILQVLACMIWYLAIRKIAGILPGLLFAGWIMLSPVEILKGLTYEPDMMYLCVFGLGLLCVAAFFAMEEKADRTRGHAIFLYLFYGMCVGLSCYLDISGVLLVVFTIGVWGLKGKTAGSYRQTRFILMLMLIFAAMVFWGIFLLVDSYCSAKTFPEILAAWWSLGKPKGMEPLFWLQIKMPYVTSMVLWGMVFCAVGSFFGKDGQRVSLWIIASGMVIGARIFRIGVMESQFTCLASYFGIILVGIVCKDLWQGMISSKRKEKVMEMAGRREPEGLEEEVTIREPVKTVPIRNPLPMPKKTIRKAMDFSVSPEDKMMHFDIEVDEKDDFDI